MKTYMIRIKNLIAEYIRRDDEGNVADIVEAIDDVSLHVLPGQFIGILGHNGSGKSTLAKHMNALLQPTEGEVIIGGYDASDKDDVWNIRKNTGMVFQNPDNQIVGSLVEEDVAFGPENIGVESDEIWTRVMNSLSEVGMTAYRTLSPNRLSGGQKQRVAIAGILAMEPRCIVFDEATAMLDPAGRKEILEIAHLLNREKHITVIMITHYMEEVVHADRVYVMNQGKLVLEGTPQVVFTHYDELIQYGLAIPEITVLSQRLNQAGIPVPANCMTKDALISALLPYQKVAKTLSVEAQSERERDQYEQKTSKEVKNNRQKADPLHSILLHQVSYAYDVGTPYEKQAISNINLSIGHGEFVAIVGHTGSGKSTLIQHLNGLLLPTEGEIYCDGKDITDRDYSRTQLRQKVGIVFQYPEHQLFANTVLEDVCFGPKNLGLPLLQVQKRAFDAIATVGLSDEVYDLSPFDLSGGQKRRVAIAGVLAMQPEYLVLDEPTAGLDPRGKTALLEQLRTLQQSGMTIILVSHNMEDVAEYAKRVIVLDRGSVLFDDTVANVFAQKEELERIGLRTPNMACLVQKMRQAGFTSLDDANTLDEAYSAITKMWKLRG